MLHVLLIGEGLLGKEILRSKPNNVNITCISRHPIQGTWGDICQIDSLKTISPLPDIIIHAASSGRGGADSYEKIYLEGWQNLRLLFPQAFPIFCSSSSVYAQNNNDWVNEFSPANPTTPTSQILRKAENIILSANGLILRLSGLYAENRHTLFENFLNGNAKLHHSGLRPINFIHAYDAARAIWFLIKTKQIGIFNLSDGNPLTEIDIFSSLCAQFNRPFPQRENRDLNSKRGNNSRKISNSKLTKLGWMPIFPSFLNWIDLNSFIYSK